MKKILIYGLSLVLMAVSSTSLTSCIDETQPTSGATEDQVQQSAVATKGLLMAIPAYLNANYFGSTRVDWAFGYGAMMHIRDCMTQDVAHVYSNYNQFSAWATLLYIDRLYRNTQYLWNYQMKLASTSNNLIAAVDSTSATNEQLGYLAAGYAYRAMIYLDMAREYEFLDNDKTQPVSPEGNDISGLTLPIVDENTTEAQARNNPRAKKADMVAFILNDLQRAEKWIGYLNLSDKTLPHLDAVYGLYARLYMWTENYPMAEKYARLAIDNATTSPMTETDALNTTTGFNDGTKWMWASQQTKESLYSNLANWTSFLSCETYFGYGSTDASPIMIDASMYQRLSDSDWRKLMWKAPSGSPLYGKNTYVDNALGAELPDYASLKFRPGEGNTDTYSIACVTDYPLMRVEEMYFIEAEAAAHQDAARGKQLLESFMKTYRDSKYSCKASSTDDVVEEIVFQKRIELWGEGQTFFDIKRLNYPVVRGYAGTNHSDDERYNTTTRPCWMNWAFVLSEENGNAGLRGYNNPNPSSTYTPWTGQ